MHHSRLCAVLIDCKTSDAGDSTRRAHRADPARGARESRPYRHRDRRHPAEVARLEKLGAKVVDRLERWVVMQAPTGQRFCVVRVQRPGFPKNANRWD
jgi:glyoxalase superfamily protein